MPDENAPQSFRGRLYAFAFLTDLTYFLGFRRSSWLKLASILLVVLAIVLRTGWLGIGLAVVVVIGVYGLYFAARRSGYVQFVALKTAKLPEPNTVLRKEQKVALRATGKFSLMERERYLVQKSAEYWHYPLRQHVIMVEEAPGRFLYQFIMAENIQVVDAGYLHLGRAGQRAIRIVYGTDWAPELVNPGAAYYVGGGFGDPKLPERTIYLTFDAEDDWQRVWQSLTGE